MFIFTHNGTLTPTLLFSIIFALRQVTTMLNYGKRSLSVMGYLGYKDCNDNVGRPFYIIALQQQSSYFQYSVLLYLKRLKDRAPVGVFECDNCQYDLG